MTVAHDRVLEAEVECATGTSACRPLSLISGPWGFRPYAAVRPLMITGPAAEQPAVGGHTGTSDHQHRLLHRLTDWARLGHWILDHVGTAPAFAEVTEGAWGAPAVAGPVDQPGGRRRSTPWAAEEEIGIYLGLLTFYQREVYSYVTDG